MDLTRVWGVFVRCVRSVHNHRVVLRLRDFRSREMTTGINASRVEKALTCAQTKLLIAVLHVRSVQMFLLTVCSYAESFGNYF